MTIQALGGPIILPSIDFTVIPGFTAMLIDAAGEKAAFIFEVPKSGTISAVGFRVHSLTTAQLLRAGLETVDPLTGDPTGTQYGGSVAGTVTPVDSTYHTVTLGTAATATAGDIVALVIQFDATAGSLNITQLNIENALSGFPYCDHYTAAWAKQTQTIPVASVEYSDGSYAYCGGMMPLSNYAITLFNSGSAADERALRINAPVPLRVIGMQAMVDLDEAADFVLYDSTGTALATVSLDKDFRAQAARGLIRRRFANAVTLSANTTYYAAVKPTTVTDVGLAEWTLPSAAARAQMHGGTNLSLATRVDGGAWTETQTVIPLIGLIVDGLDNGVGGAIGGGDVEKFSIDKGAVDTTLTIMIRRADNGQGLAGLAFNTAGLVASYARHGAARQAIALVTQTVAGAHVDGGFIEIDAANMPGLYRLDVPDALAATGTSGAMLELRGAANMLDKSAQIELLDVINANNPIAANTVQINSDSTSAQQLSKGAKAIVSGAAVAGTLSTTQMTTNLTETTTDHYKDRSVVWRTGALAGQAKAITAYNGATKMLTFQAATEAPAAADEFDIV